MVASLFFASTSWRKTHSGRYFAFAPAIQSMNKSHFQTDDLSQKAIALLTQRLDELESGERESGDPGNVQTSFPAAVRIKVSDFTPLDWLGTCGEVPRFVWSDRGSEGVWAGAGEAAVVSMAQGEEIGGVFSRCHQLLRGNRELRFFGGFSFDGSSSWPVFGAGRFVLPRIQWVDGEIVLAVMNPEDIHQARVDLQQIGLDTAPLSSSLPRPSDVSHSPNFNGWQTRIDEALALIRSEAVEKLVLSRKTVLHFSEALDPISAAAKLKESTHDCFVFCFDCPGSFSGDHGSIAETDEGVAFVGATPERLFRRRERALESEVIAGTRKRGDNAEDDRLLAAELLASDKDQREHDIVRKSIRQKLHQFVDHLEVDNQASLLRLARKQHLRSNVQGSIKPDVDDAVLLSQLHPTPAVGGYPTENALPEIARIEPFNRGWFAAPVGWIGSDDAEFAVAIRSGFIQGNTVTLFSGAGIVRGSEPAEEWQEVENKIQDFMSILGD